MQPKRYPNLLLILTDTSRTDTLACMGNPHAVSPNLDRLAAEGVLFEQAHTCSPVCGPARCSLLTGTYPPVHGVIENGIQRRREMVTLPDLLAQSGYHNVMVGKTHFDPIPESFHVQHALRGEKTSDADDFYGRFIRGKGFPRATQHPNPVPAEDFVDAHCVDMTIQELDKHRQSDCDAPFFAICSLLSPHAPLDPPAPWDTLYDDLKLPPLNWREGETREHPEHQQKLLGMTDDHPQARWFPGGQPDMKAIDHERRLYYGLAAYCDAQIGRLLQYLDESGLRDETLVVFSSDHGTTNFDHGFENKHNYYDASWRVPLLMRLPGVLPAGHREQFAGWTDITASLLGAAGISHPAIQGIDLFSPLARGGSTGRTCATACLYTSCALVSDRWKLEYYFEESTGRLFDRHSDPREQIDRYDDPEVRPLRDALLQALLTWHGELLPIQYLHEHNPGGGPVARRTLEMLCQRTGLDAEVRLSHRVQQIEADFPLRHRDQLVS